MARNNVERLTQIISAIIDLHDPTAAGHQWQVAQLAKAIAEEMCPEQESIDCVSLAGLMHDVGKIVVPTEILSMKGELSLAQQEVVKKHVHAGYVMLEAVEFPGNIAETVYQHHERLDGSGYPRGLEREKILLEARILSVADVVQAMYSSRSYHPALSTEKVLEELQLNKGNLYDTEVVNTYIRIVKRKFQPAYRL